MKNLILALAFLAGTSLLSAQTIDLCGTSGPEISVSQSMFQESTTLVFCNTEYLVQTFELKFAVVGNPGYSATSSNANFTSEMITNFNNRVPGEKIQLTINLDVADVEQESTPWSKVYSITVLD